MGVDEDGVAGDAVDFFLRDFVRLLRGEGKSDGGDGGDGGECEGAMRDGQTRGLSALKVRD